MDLHKKHFLGVQSNMKISISKEVLYGAYYFIGLFLITIIINLVFFPSGDEKEILRLKAGDHFNPIERGYSITHYSGGEYEFDQGRYTFEIIINNNLQIEKKSFRESQGRIAGQWCMNILILLLIVFFYTGCVHGVIRYDILKIPRKSSYF